MMMSAQQALEHLQQGNQRFVSGESARPWSVDPRRGLDGQTPFAVVLGCSDSRVPVELVFDQTLGDLFVIRVAGNIAAPSQIGSIEYAAEQLGTPLVVVLGHSHCGAVTATIKELQQPSGNQSPNLRAITDRIQPSVAELVASPLAEQPQTLIHHAVRANVRATVDQLRHGSAILEPLVRDGQLMVVGAAYYLETGEVDFFDGIEPT